MTMAGHWQALMEADLHSHTHPCTSTHAHTAPPALRHLHPAVTVDRQMDIPQDALICYLRLSNINLKYQKISSGFVGDCQDLYHQNYVLLFFYLHRGLSTRR